MLINANDIASGQTIDADICIVGAGAAGITIAREFRDSRLTVCLLEAGRRDADPESQALYLTIKNLGRDYPFLYGSRLRYFGGSTNHWGGHCVPLRRINFERLPWSRYSGWPISFADLEPFYRRAEAVLGLEQASQNPTTVAARLGRPLFPFDPARLETQVSRYRPVRFGTEFGRDLEQSRNIRVVLQANATSLEANREGTLIGHIVVRTLEGRTFNVRARAYILAAGGIENPRLLLASRSVHSRGLGNGNDLVGRFFMEHIWYPKGDIVPAAPGHLNRLYTEEMPADGVAYRAHLVLPEQVVRDAGIPDFRCELANVPVERDAVTIRSARVLRDSLRKLDWPEDLGGHVLNVIRDPQTVWSTLWDRAPRAYRLQNHVEQAPNPASRIALGIERDALGMPIATIDWRLSDVDKQGIRFAHACIAREVGRSGFGRMLANLPDDESEILTGADGASHHMGTTRMHGSPKLGVVDSNCRVHDLANLYVAGSSVFPTVGYANPTFTIVALAIRLSDHIKLVLPHRG